LFKRLIAIGGLACLAPLTALAQRSDTGTPSLKIPLPSTSDAADVSGLEINPSALGFLQSYALAYYGGFSLTGDRLPGSGNAAFVSFGTGGFSLALGSEFLSSTNKNFFDESLGAGSATKLSIGTGIGFGTAFSMGISLARFISDADAGLDGMRTIDAGFTIRPNRYLSFAAVGYDLNTPVATKFDGARLAIPASYNLSAGIRPLGNDKLTITLDSGFGEPEDAAFLGVLPRAGIALQPLDGVIVRGEVDFELAADTSAPAFSGFQAGLTFNRAHAGATAAVASEGGDNFLFTSVRISGESYPEFPIGSDHFVEISLSGSLSEKTSAASLLPGASPKTFYALIKRLQEATEDEHVTGILFKMNGLSVNSAQIEELHKEIYAFRAKGKKCFVYMNDVSGKEYQLASACDKITVSPGGTVMLAGLMSQVPFYKDAFGKIGVEPQFIRIGKFKSAPESYTETQPTQPNIEVREELLDDMYGLLVAQVAKGRKLDETKVKELIDNGPYTATEAQKVGLIDSVEYYDDMKKRLGKENKDISWKTFDNSSPEQLSWGPKPVIMVLVVDGTISQGKNSVNPLQGGSTSGAETIIKSLQYAASTDRVKAVILRVDSPGGDALASDLIWHAVEKVKEKKKPVIVSMASVAASGGYYVAAGADEIFADKSTITGSIGIFGGKFVMAGLYEKLGINYAVFKRGAHVDWQTNLRPWSEEEKAQYFLKISEFYNTFTSKVAKGRGLTQERVDELGRGHVYTGERAIGLKLVTKQGGLADAIAFAQEKAGLKEEPEISFAPKESSSLLTSLLGGLLKAKTQETIDATLPPMVLEALQGAFPSFLYLDPDVPWALMTEMIEIR
jgi:protease-4